MADAERIAGRLEQLWQIARGPGGGADRPAYSEAEAQAMRLVAGWAGELGLEAAIDPDGNLWALPHNHGGALVTSGSHVDTVPDGGRYDGALGTVLALELAAELTDAPSGTDARPALLVCAAEEAPRFGAGTVGSRLLAGSLSESELAELHDADGISAVQARVDYLAALDGLPRLDRPPLDRIRAHAEVHVALRAGPDELGIVTRVASPRRLEIVIGGEAGHAGEIGMDERRDALAGAAEIVLEVERAARAAPRPTVATAGTLTVSPGGGERDPGRGAARGRHARGRDRTARPARGGDPRGRPGDAASGDLSGRAPRSPAVVRRSRSTPSSPVRRSRPRRPAGSRQRRRGRARVTTCSTSPPTHPRCSCSSPCAAGRATRRRRART